MRGVEVNENVKGLLATSLLAILIVAYVVPGTVGRKRIVNVVMPFGSIGEEGWTVTVKFAPPRPLIFALRSPC